MYACEKNTFLKQRKKNTENILILAESKKNKRKKEGRNKFKYIYDH